MGEAVVIKCKECGAPLNAEINREFIFCQYCGCKNMIASEQMKTDIDIGGIHVKAKTDIDSMITSAEYAISIKQYEKANEMLMAAILSGTADHRVFVAKAKIDLMLDDNGSLFDAVRNLQRLEEKQSPEREVTKAVCELMQVRGKAGVTILHDAAFHELMDMVVYCVEHGSDVNCIAGMNRVSPISIMFVPISKKLCKLDGTPFIRDKKKVKEIRRYLMEHGAKDKMRIGY